MGLIMGIVGMPNVGKSTLFKALTRKPVIIANYPFATIDPNVGVVPVPDKRLDTLAAMSKSKKVVPAAVEFMDIAGLVKGASQGLGLGNAFLSHIRDADAILHVVRVFENSDLIHVEKAPDPERDFEIIKLELIIKDLDTVEKAFEKAESEARSGDLKRIERREILSKLKAELTGEKLLSQISLAEDESLAAKELGLLSIKPMLIVFNISDKELESKWSPDGKLLSALGGISYIALPIGIESEASSLPEEESKDFLELAGIKERGFELLIRKSYETLGLMTFFTTGEDESRAWTIKLNSTAPQAGRAIHTDFETKFIRADVIPYDELIAIGSWSAAREKGKVRSEGKEYIVKDGDVIEFRI